MEHENRSGGFSGSIVGLGRREAEGWGCKGRERDGGAGEEQFMSSCMEAGRGEVVRFVMGGDCLGRGFDFDGSC